MQKMRAIIAIAVVSALVASAAPAHAVTSRGGDKRVDSLIRVLARSGIAVVDDPTDEEPIRRVTEPLSPVRLVRSQVENMAIELAGDGGVTGAKLDELVAMPDNALPISYLIAGWVKAAATPGARDAKKLLGRQDWEQAPTIAFPSIVLALFTSDSTRELAPDAVAPPLGGPSAAQAGPVGGTSARTGPVASACTALSGFISGGVSAIYDALTFASAATALNWMQRAWDAGVKYAIEGAGAVLGVLLDTFLPFLPAIRKALGVIAAVHAFTSLLVNWTVTIKPTPSSTHVAVGSESPTKGEFAASVDVPNSIEWPDGLPECASLLNVTLPKLSAKGAPVVWLLFEDSLDAGLTTYSLENTNYDADATLNAQLEAKLDFTVNKETNKVHQQGDLVEDKLTAQLTVPRTDVATLRTLLKGMLFAEFPGLAGELLNQQLKEDLSPLIDELTDVAKPFAQAQVAISRHTLGPCRYPDSKIDPCLVGEWESKQLALPFPPEFKYAGGTGAVMTITTDGKLTLDYEPSLLLGINIAGLPGTAKLHGKGTATVTTQFEIAGTGTVASSQASLGQARADVDFAGVKQNVGMGSAASLNGSYVIQYLNDANRPDELVLTVPTSVGPVIAVWVRVR